MHVFTESFFSVCFSSVFMLVKFYVMNNLVEILKLKLILSFMLQLTYDIFAFILLYIEKLLNK